jgi:aminopeptidase N
MHYADFPKYVAGNFSRAEQLEAYKAFFEPKLDEPELARTITQGVEDIESRVLWRERDEASVIAFLKVLK